MPTNHPLTSGPATGGLIERAMLGGLTYRPARREFRVRRTLLAIFAVVLLEGAIAVLDGLQGRTFPITYFYVLPVLVGALYLGYAGGIGAAVLSVVLFDVIRQNIHHSVFARADFLWLMLLVLVGVVTAQMQQDRRRVQAQNRELARLNRAREELTTLIVHDLRTPLAAVLTVLRMLSEDDRGALSDAHADLVDLAVATGDDMMGMIGDLLSLHTMENAAFTVSKSHVAVPDVVETAIRQVQPIARQRRITINTRLAEPLPSLSADEVVLRRVLVNLVGNALRLSPAGSAIEIGVEQIGTELVFHVTDQGPGIPEQLRSRLFDKYARADQEVGKHISTGLGLAFAKMAVEAHGGRIWVESPWPAPPSSPANPGSRFSFSLPLAE